MCYMPIAHRYRVALRSTLDGSIKIANTFAIADTDTATAPDIRVQDIANALAATGSGSIVTAYAGMLTAADKLAEVHVSQIPDPAIPHDPVFQASAFPNLSGTRAGSTVDAPHEMTATLTLQTALSGRRFRGRMFLPPAKQQGAQAGELWDTGNVYWTSLNTFATQLGKLLAASGSRFAGTNGQLNLIVWSNKARLADGSYTGINVAATRLNQKIHWLRSRAS